MLQGHPFTGSHILGSSWEADNSPLGPKEEEALWGEYYSDKSNKSYGENGEDDDAGEIRKELPDPRA